MMSSVKDRGLKYYKSGRVLQVVKCGPKLYGVVRGNAIYRVVIDLKREEDVCTCPVGFKCKHVEAVKAAYLSKDCIQLNEDQEVEAILSLLTPIIPQRDMSLEALRKAFIFYSELAKSLQSFDYREGYSSMVETSGITYALSLLVNVVGDLARLVIDRVIELIRISVETYDVHPHIPVNLVSLENLWRALISHVDPSRFSREERDKLFRAYLMSQDLIEDEAFLEEISRFVKGLRFIPKVDQDVMLGAMFWAALKPNDMYRYYEALDKLMELLNACLLANELSCVYKVLSSLPDDMLSSALRQVEYHDAKLAEDLRRKLKLLGIKSVDLTGVLSYEERCVEELVRLIDEAGSVEKALFYARWARGNLWSVAEKTKESYPEAAVMLYLRSSKGFEEVRTSLLELVREIPLYASRALLALIQAEADKTNKVGYMRVIETVEALKNIALEVHEVRSHYEWLVRQLVELNRNRKKLLSMLARIEPELVRTDL